MMMAAGIGASSPGSSALQSNSGSEEDLRQVMDQRKRKRMISNRESARRSRMRKQKHLDDLMAQVAQLRKENAQIVSFMNVSTQRYLNAEAENSILKAQVAELTHRLESLNEIADFLNNPPPPLPPPPQDGCGGGGFGFPGEYNDGVFLGQSESPAMFNDGFFVNNNSWNFMVANQPIMTPASADILQY